MLTLFKNYIIMPECTQKIRYFNPLAPTPSLTLGTMGILLTITTTTITP